MLKATINSFLSKGIYVCILLFFILSGGIFFKTPIYSASNSEVLPPQPSATPTPEYSSPYGNVTGAELKFNLYGKFNGGNKIVGLNDKSNKTLIWNKDGSHINYSNEVVLLNTQNVVITPNILKFCDLGDVDGNGDEELVCIQGGTNWVYMWEITNTSSDNTNIKPKYEGELTSSNQNGSPIRAEDISFFIAGDFDGDGKDDIRALQANTSRNYTWNNILNSEHKITVKSNDVLRDRKKKAIPVNSITAAFPIKLEGQSKDMLLVTSEDGYYIIDENSNTFKYSSFCNNNRRCDGKQLLFKIDEVVFEYYDSNDPRANTAITRLIETLKKFQSKYEVLALINPQNTNKKNLRLFLDRLKDEKIKFVLDVYTSDTNVAGSRNLPGINAYDYIHGLSLAINESDVSLQNLSFYAKKYGTYLAGIRFHELFSYTYHQKGWCPTSPDKCSNLNFPESSFYNKNTAEKYIKFAEQNNMFVIWNEAAWPLIDQEFYQFEDYPKDLQYFLSKYDSTIILSYANNDNFITQQPEHYKLQSWFSTVNKYAGKKVGLSDQSWMCDPAYSLYNDENCPSVYLAVWASNALTRRKVSTVEFEPFWYLWSWDRKKTADHDPDTSNGEFWNYTMYPTDNLKYIAFTLGVQL